MPAISRLRGQSDGNSARAAHGRPRRLPWTRQSHYEVNERAEAYLGVTNLFDRDPPLIPTPYLGSVSGTETVPFVYETIGRSFYGGVRIRF